MKKLLLVSAAALVAMATLAKAETSHFQCVPNLFGCNMKYTGPTDEAAAKQYFEESQAAIDWILNADKKNIATAHYSPAKAELVIQMHKGGNRVEVPTQAIFSYFREKALTVDRIVIMDNAMVRVKKVAGNTRSYNSHGRTRFAALQGVPFRRAGGPASPGLDDLGKKAFGSVRRGEFGDYELSIR